MIFFDDERRVLDWLLAGDNFLLPISGWILQRFHFHLMSI